MAITILALGRGNLRSQEISEAKISDFSGIRAWGNARGSSLAPRIPPMAIVHADLEFAWGSSLLGAGPR
jgi:hypothetical protein